MVTDKIQKAWSRFVRDIGDEFDESYFTVKTSSADSGSKSTLKMTITDDETNKVSLSATVAMVDHDEEEKNEKKKKKKNKKKEGKDSGVAGSPEDD